MDVKNILSVSGLAFGVVASILIASNTFPDEPLLGQIPVISDDAPNGDEENKAITARNKKRAYCRRIGFYGLVLGFAIQILAYAC